jgi:hypothetical protein
MQTTNSAPNRRFTEQPAAVICQEEKHRVAKQPVAVEICDAFHDERLTPITAPKNLPTIEKKRPKTRPADYELRISVSPKSVKQPTSGNVRGADACVPPALRKSRQTLNIHKL